MKVSCLKRNVMDAQTRRLLDTYYLKIRDDLFILRRKKFFLHEIIDFLLENKNRYGYKKLFGFFCISDIVLQAEKQVILSEIRSRDQCLANELELIWMLNSMNMVDGFLFKVDSIFSASKNIDCSNSYEDSASEKARKVCEFLSRYDKKFFTVASEVFSDFEGLEYKAFGDFVLHNSLTNVEVRDVLDMKIFFRDNFENMSIKRKRVYLSWENAAFFVKHLELNINDKINEDFFFINYEKFVLDNKANNFIKYIKKIRELQNDICF